jgi:hydrogenase maturation factor
MSATTSVTGIAIELPAPELPKGEREYQAFLRLLPELLATHRGKYVAIHDGRVVDSDASDVALIQRVQKRVGYVPIHVGFVTDQQSVVRIPHYREHRPRGSP